MNPFRILGKNIGEKQPVYIIAELSANHGGDYNKALELIAKAKDTGADAVKIQTYTADTLTLKCDAPCFRIEGGTLWDGLTLHDLYSRAYTPWEWQASLKAHADRLGLHFFSSPFDASAVDFLEKLNVPAYKIASFEIVDIPLIKKVAATGKPIILSTGMATSEEISQAVQAARKVNPDAMLALLKCASAYPAQPEDMNLSTIRDMREKFGIPIGLSDHTMGSAVAIASVAMGGCIIEKHLTLSRSEPGPDSAFSMEPAEFTEMVASVRTVERALGSVNYGCTPGEIKNRRFRRSLFVVEDIAAGGAFTPDNIRSIRPGDGLSPRHFDAVIGKKASRSIPRGTPLSWDMIAGA